MQDILYDFHVAQSMAEQHRDSTNYKRYSFVRAVFDKYNITEAEFDSSMVWYSTHTTYLNQFYKNIRQRYEDQVALLGVLTGSGDVFANLNADGDTADIWNDRKFRVLKLHPSEDRYTFNITADTTFKKGDTFIWRFGTKYVTNGKQGEAYAGFYVRYDNDSTAGIALRIYANNQMELRVDGDTSYQANEIGGFVFFKSSNEPNDPTLLLMRDIMLVRMHPVEEPIDTLRTSTSEDSILTVLDSATFIQHQDTTHRLSPTELRDSRTIEHSINIVKEKPIIDVRRAKRNNKKNQ